MSDEGRDSDRRRRSDLLRGLARRTHAGARRDAELGLPGLANVALNGALVWAAFYGIRKGFNEWQRQFFARRDHDLAVRLLSAVHRARKRLSEFRHRGRLVSDGELPALGGVTIDVSEQAKKFDHYFARFKVRLARLAEAIETRDATKTEVLNVWGDLGASVARTLDVLAEQEVMFRRAAEDWTIAFQNYGAPTTIDEDVVFRPDEKADFAMMVYDTTAARLQAALLHKLRME